MTLKINVVGNLNTITVNINSVSHRELLNTEETLIIDKTVFDSIKNKLVLEDRKINLQAQV